MKIFNLDIISGEKKLIREMPAVSWVGKSLEDQVDIGIYRPTILNFKIPFFGRDAEVLVAEDAGIVRHSNGQVFKESYITENHWICFCLGKESPSANWSWIILPPRNQLYAARTEQEMPTEQEIDNSNMERNHMERTAYLLHFLLDDIEKCEDYDEFKSILGKIRTLSTIDAR